MGQTYITSLVTGLILLFMAGTFLFFYLRFLQQDMKYTWLSLLEKLQLRLDKIPNLIETIKTSTTSQENLIQEMIELRSKSYIIENSDIQKVQIELNVSEKIHLFWNLMDQFPQLQHNTNFLALKKEFQALNIDIDQKADKYNEKVRHYNAFVKPFFLKPVVIILGFRPSPIFEFEE